MRLIVFALALEALTGLVLVGVPSLLGRLILGTELPASAQVMGRLAGIALLAFSAACWPDGGRTSNTRAAVRGLLLYNLLATVFFTSLGARGVAGPLLWPVVAIHAILSVLFVRLALAGNKP
jgi:hypothetical protein